MSITEMSPELVGCLRAKLGPEAGKAAKGLIDAGDGVIIDTSNPSE
jgi:hypothetical protein